MPSFTALCVLLVFVAGICAAPRPHPCRSPPLLQGSFSVTNQDGQFWGFGKYVIDGFRQRVRLRDFTRMQNESRAEDLLLLYEEGVVYSINRRERTCVKKQLQASFHPLQIPSNSTLLGQVVLGSLSAPGEGVLVNSWGGNIDDVQYFLTFTEFGCIPVTSINSVRGSWIAYSFFNIVVGIEDPGVLIPPPYCQQTTLELEEMEDFFSPFL